MFFFLVSNESARSTAFHQSRFVETVGRPQDADLSVRFGHAHGLCFLFRSPHLFCFALKLGWQAIAGVFRELSDAHTRYRPTACYLKVWSLVCPRRWRSTVAQFNFYTGLPLYGYASSPFTAPILAVVDPEGVAAGLDPRDRGFESLKRVARQISILNRAIDVLMTMNKQLGPLWQKQVRTTSV